METPNIKIFELRDLDGESLGLLAMPTNAPLTAEELAKKWSHFFDDEEGRYSDSPVEQFSDNLNAEGFEATRFFIEEEIVP